MKCVLMLIMKLIKLLIVLIRVLAVLHTFGRDIKWNPHIHILIAEMKLSNNKIQDQSYFNYDALLYRYICKSFYKVKCDMYKKYPNGFYVYAEKKKF